MGTTPAIFRLELPVFICHLFCNGMFFVLYFNRNGFCVLCAVCTLRRTCSTRANENLRATPLYYYCYYLYINNAQC